MRSTLALALVPLFLVGCGGGGGSNEVTGTIGGKTFVVADSAGNDLAGGLDANGTVVLSSFDGLCKQIGANTATVNSQLLALTLFEGNGSHAVVPAHAGQYTFSTLLEGVKGQFFNATYETIGATLGDVVPVTATAGTVTLTGFANQHYAGSFDLMFGSDHVTGSFDAPKCAALTK